MTDPFAGIAAQDAAVAILRAAARGRLASAYLFEGPSGVGKRAAAIALAQTVIGATTEPEKRADVLRRIGVGAHPDVRTFAPRDEGDRNIQVETVREQILPFAQFAPFEAKSAFVVLPEADVSFPEIHPEGANAILKTLEEPRPGVHFVLLAEKPDKLLVTIRSRCQRVRFSRLPDAILASILEAAGVAPEARTAAIALADGRADRALALAAEGAADALLEVALRIDLAAESGSAGEKVALAEDIARKSDPAAVLDALAAFYRDVAAAALGSGDERLAFRHRSDRIRERAKVVGAARAARACERIRALEERLEQNANAELGLDRLFFELAR
jgi:DNA polymerase-3 subunit delta'